MEQHVAGKIAGNSSSSSSSVHVAMLPWFAFGHINPFIQLANKLSSHNIKISFLSASGNIPRIKSSLMISSQNIQIIPLTIPPLPGLPQGLDNTSEMTPSMAELLKEALDQMQPQIKTILSQLKPHAVFHDFAQYWMPSLASQLGIKSVFYSVFSAIANAYLTVPSRVRKNSSHDGDDLPSIQDLKKPPPGFPESSSVSSPFMTFQAQNFMYIFTKFNDKPSVFDRFGSVCECDAFVYKSCNEMESPYLDYLSSQFGKPTFVAGPAVPDHRPPSSPVDPGLADWLSKFQAKSVIFCSFGSETFLEPNQIRELALGLELTKHPFLLVLNFPQEGDHHDHVDSQVAKLNEALPEGFMERIKDRGIIRTGWVQQQQILGHVNVGCYVNHGGYGSVMEGLINDCRLVLVPQKGDQFLNSRLMSKDLEVGIEVKRRDSDGYFGREDILEAVKIVMDDDEELGRRIRENQSKWKEFLCNAEIQEKYTATLVEDIKALVLN